jgi:hypothetical protein
MNEDECKYKWQYENRWQCQHDPQCQNGEQCREEMCNCNKVNIQSHRRKSLHKKCHDRWMKQNKWECKHNPTCQNEWECKRDCECRNEWQEENTQEELEDKFFRRRCEKCNRFSWASSFRLYMQKPKDINVGKFMGILPCMRY